MNIIRLIKRTAGVAIIFIIAVTTTQFIFPDKSLAEIFVYLALFFAGIGFLLGISLFILWCFDD